MQKPGPDSALPWQQKGLQGLSPWSLNLKTWHTCPRKGLPSTWLLELLWGRIEVENQRCGLLFLFVCCFANDKWEKVLPEAQASPDPKGAVQRMKPKAAPVQHCQDSSGLCFVSSQSPIRNSGGHTTKYLNGTRPRPTPYFICFLLPQTRGSQMAEKNHQLPT